MLSIKFFVIAHVFVTTYFIILFEKIRVENGSSIPAGNFRIFFRRIPTEFPHFPTRTHQKKFWKISGQKGASTSGDFRRFLVGSAVFSAFSRRFLHDPDSGIIDLGMIENSFFCRAS